MFSRSGGTSRTLNSWWTLNTLRRGQAAPQGRLNQRTIKTKNQSRFDNGERFDLRLPFVEKGWVDEAAEPFRWPWEKAPAEEAKKATPAPAAHSVSVLSMTQGGGNVYHTFKIVVVAK